MRQKIQECLISSDDLLSIALDRVLEGCVCASPQGRERKEAQGFFGSADRDALEEVWQEISALRPLSRASLRRDWDAALTLLSRFRGIRGTLSRMRKGAAMSTAELFEIKRCLELFEELSEKEALLKAAGLVIVPIPGAKALLNPKGKSVPGFYVYSDYDPELLDIREHCRRLEQRIAGAESGERKSLLEERSVLVSREHELETEILGRISRELQAFAEPFADNLQASAELDFLMAKAAMAESWQSPEAVILEAGEGTYIEDVFHPIIRSSLEEKGLQFTPQSIQIRKGSTVITGPNMGGKSVALRSFFLIQLLFQLGYPLPCSVMKSELYDFLAFSQEHGDDATAGLSSFGAEAAALRDQLTRGRAERGLVVLDEPCRGTNPREARAIVRALCRIYAEIPASLLIATHFSVPAEEGLYFYRIVGLREEDFKDLSDKGRPDPHMDPEERDRAAVRLIREHMNYRLVETDGKEHVPEAAIRIAEWMGLDEAAIREMRAAYYEEELWPH